MCCLCRLPVLGVPKEETDRDLGLRLVAEARDLASLKRFAQQCHYELAYYFPAAASTTDAAMLTICHDVPPPKDAVHPVLLTSASSREEQAYQIFKAFLQRDFIDPRLPAMSATRLSDLDWLIAGLTFSYMHGTSFGDQRIVPDARPLLGFYLGIKPFCFADWVSEPIPPSPSLAYRLYGLNSLHLIGFFNCQPNASAQAWLVSWSRGTSVQEAACQLLTPKGKPEALDVWLTKAMADRLKESLALTAEDLQKQTARLDTWPVTRGAAIETLDLADAARLIGRETVGKQRLEDYLWLINHTLMFLKPAMRDLADGAAHLQKGNGWRSERAFASGRHELEKQLDYSRQVQRYLDGLEVSNVPLRKLAPSLFMIEDKATMDELQQAPAMYYWLENLESRTAAP
jgi:hypothetical protein